MSRPDPNKIIPITNTPEMPHGVCWVSKVAQILLGQAPSSVINQPGQAVPVKIDASVPCTEDCAAFNHIWDKCSFVLAANNGLPETRPPDLSNSTVDKLLGEL